MPHRFRAKEKHRNRTTRKDKQSVEARFLLFIVIQLCNILLCGSCEPETMCTECASTPVNLNKTILDISNVIESITRDISFLNEKFPSTLQTHNLQILRDNMLKKPASVATACLNYLYHFRYDVWTFIKKEVRNGEKRRRIIERTRSKINTLKTIVADGRNILKYACFCNLQGGLAINPVQQISQTAVRNEERSADQQQIPSFGMTKKVLEFLEESLNRVC